MKKIARVAAGSAVLLCLDGSSSRAGELESAWKSAKAFNVTESVLHDAGAGVFYVSNINGGPLEKNKSGFISKWNPDGSPAVLKWVDGLNAPKGMGLRKGRLYVTDIDRLVEIDIERGIVLKRYPAPNAVFLNDIAVSPQGTLFVSDMSAENSVIYRFEGDTPVPWLRDPRIRQPNGLEFEDGFLWAGTFSGGGLFRVDPETKTIRKFAEAPPGIDGLARDGAGGFFVSDWNGKISHVDSSGRVRTLLDNTSRKINAADIEYIPERNLLLVPTFFDHRVLAYRWKED